MKKILLIDASFREGSRTKELTDYLLSKLEGEVIRLDLEKLNLKPLDKNDLDMRTALLEKKDYSHPFFNEAKLFKDADLIVFSTPYYDFSFSALIKVFIEHINCDGITFGFTEKGEYLKYCKANDVIYVTTSGGPLKEEFGFNYIKALDEVFYGIPNTHLIKAENLDIIGMDNNIEMEKAKKSIDELVKQL